MNKNASIRAKSQQAVLDVKTGARRGQRVDLHVLVFVDRGLLSARCLTPMLKQLLDEVACGSR
jgi:hypothetical protein